MSNRFSSFHPLVAFCYFVGAIASVMLFSHPYFLGSGLAIIFLIHYVYDRWNSLSNWLFFMLTTGGLIFILNPLFNERGRQILIIVWGHRITREALLFGGISALSIIAVMSLFVSYNVVMTPNKLLFLFSKILPQFAILLMLTLRFIPLMRKRLLEIADVQISKGISVYHGTWKERTRNGMDYIKVLLTYSLEEAIQTANSMNARGYGLTKRTTYEFFRLKMLDILMIIILVGLMIALLYGRVQGYGALTIYPSMEIWDLSGEEIGLLFIYLLMLSLPLVVEVWGFVRWRLLM